MNTDQLKGIGKDVGGKIQKEAGKLTGDPGTQARGQARQTEGKLQKGLGDAKEVVHHTAERLDRSTRRDGL